MIYKCDIHDCANRVDVGYSNPSLVVCADCNEGEAAWNCVDFATHSCDCDFCGPPKTKDIRGPSHSHPCDEDEDIPF